MTQTLPPGVQRFLDASTAHITPGDDAILRAWAAMEPETSTAVAPYRTIPHACGYLVHVHMDEDFHPDAAANARDQGMSPAFFALQDYARANGCWWINLDRDADVIRGAGLKVYEW